jgi:hypothetical protein
MDISTTTATLKENGQGFEGHIQRMDSTGMTKKILQWKQVGR